jgi:hypothetical protein
MSEAKEVCRAFRNGGRCRYGEECNYEHSEGDPIEPPPRGQCFNFEQTEECSYGERCRYLHGEDDDGSRFVKKPKQPRVQGEGAAAGEGGAKKKRRNRRQRTTPTEKLDEGCNNYQVGSNHALLTSLFYSLVPHLPSKLQSCMSLLSIITFTPLFLASFVPLLNLT